MVLQPVRIDRFVLHGPAMFGHFGQALRVGVAADQQRRDGLIVVFLVQALDGVNARLVLRR